MSDAGSAAAGAPSIRATSLDASIEAWRDRDAHLFDPVRFRFIEALARRAARFGGDVQRIVGDRVAALLDAYGDDFERARSGDGNRGSGTVSSTPAQAAGDPADREPRLGTLAELIGHIARETSLHGHPPVARDVLSSLASTQELKALSHFRSTWSKLSADRRLTQSLAKVPENAGPLNSHHLMHRSLMLMRELSPEYLNLFMSYVDALLWLDQVNGCSASAGKDSPRPHGDRKPARTRSR